MCSSDLKNSHVFHHSYLEEAIGQQGGFHLHLPPFYDVNHLVLHAWEEILEERFVVDHWRLLMRRPQEEEGRIFSFLIHFLEDKKHFGGENCNFPNF